MTRYNYNIYKPDHGGQCDSDFEGYHPGGGRGRYRLRRDGGADQFECKRFAGEHVGVDIGCGVMTVQTNLSASDLPENMKEIRANIEKAVPLEATRGVECRKDKDVIDETPGAYKDIDAVMEAQKDLVEIAHTLRQIVCVKG